MSDAARETVSADWLFEGLKAHERRRLFFLLRALDDVSASEAVALALSLEQFIAESNTRSGSEANRQSTLGTQSALFDSPPHAHVNTEAVDHAEEGKQRPAEGNAARPDTGSIVASDRSDRKGSASMVPRAEFLSAVASGASNRQLADRFGLTPRQAHGLRIGLARRKAALSQVFLRKAPRGRSKSEIGASDSVDNQLKEQFLRTKTPAPETMEDVIRFLRQMGDVVVADGDRQKFVLNFRQSLTTDELIERANRKRTERGKPLFKVERCDTQRVSVAEPVAPKMAADARQ